MRWRPWQPPPAHRRSCRRLISLAAHRRSALVLSAQTPLSVSYDFSPSAFALCSPQQAAAARRQAPHPEFRIAVRG